MPTPPTSTLAAGKTALGVAVVHIEHNDGYLNMTPLGPGYGAQPSCMKCAADCDNDMLLMSGFLCHQCIPDNCRRGVYKNSAGTCKNLLVWVVCKLLFDPTSLKKSAMLSKLANLVRVCVHYFQPEPV